MIAAIHAFGLISTAGSLGQPSEWNLLNGIFTEASQVRGAFAFPLVVNAFRVSKLVSVETEIPGSVTPKELLTRLEASLGAFKIASNVF